MALWTGFDAVTGRVRGWADTGEVLDLNPPAVSGVVWLPGRFEIETHRLPPGASAAEALPPVPHALAGLAVADAATELVLSGLPAGCRVVVERAGATEASAEVPAGGELRLVFAEAGPRALRLLAEGCRPVLLAVDVADPDAP